MRLIELTAAFLSATLSAVACTGPQEPLEELELSDTKEFHFQEGFSGEPVDIILDGEQIAHFEARTRLQLGLAHIVTHEIHPGQTVKICVGDIGLENSFQVEEVGAFITINIVDGSLIVENIDIRPGYV